MAITSNDGSILCGTYQFSFRLIKQDDVSGDGIYNEVYSKFSILTNPVHISDKIDSLLAGDGRIGKQTNNRIQLDINISVEERTFYTHYQVALVRRLDGAGVPGLEAFVLPPVSFSSIMSFPSTYEYSSNVELKQIAIANIITEDAHIDTAKTLTIKSNRLFLGNIKYKSLNVSPSWGIDTAATTPIVQDIGLGYDPLETYNGYSNDYVSHKYRGHFRDEVYRYAISYVDKFGNWSKGHVIDFSTVTNNYNSDPNCVDFKFPSRSEDGFKLFNSDGKLTSLGLRLAGIHDHPSWAIGFTILRAKRKKNILFQTPLIPTVHIQPPKAGENISNGYPANDGVTLADFAGTLAVKEFFYPISRNIKRLDETVSTTYECEYRLQALTDPETYTYVVFPQNMIYNNNGDVLDVYNDNSVYRWNLIDAASLRMDKDDYGNNPDSYDEGDYIDSKRSAVFYANYASQYYYEEGQTKPELNTITNLEYLDVPIKEFGYINNGDEKYVIRSTVNDLVPPSFGNYAGVKDSEAIDVTPQNQKMGFMVSEYGIRDIAYESFESNDAYVNDSISFNWAAGAGSEEAIPNSLIADKDSQAWHSDESNIVNVVGIANVEVGLEDTRYGDISEYHEFISTGATYMFSSTELAGIVAGDPVPITVDVFGGDCYISRHNFKISDSLYHLTYADDDADALAKWGSEIYAITGSLGETANFDRPIAVNGASQIIQIYLEGEVNADVISRFTITNPGNNLSLKEGGEYELNVFNNYDYMLSYSNENSQKIFLVREELERDSNDFRARVHYTNQKVYETAIQGFDVVSAFDFYDLEGKYGELNKLVTFNNRMYSIQENSFAYIPINANVIETADSETLSIRTAEIMGNIQYISTTSGTQRLKSVVTTGGFVTFFDDNDKKLNIFTNTVESLSDKGVSSYFDSLNITSDTNGIFSYNSYVDNKLFFVNDSDTIIYDVSLNLWNYEVDISADILGFGSLDDKEIVVGRTSSGSIVIHNMDISVNTFLGSTLYPSVEFYVVPQPSIPVTFDNIVLDANYRMSSVEMFIEKDNSMTNNLYMWSDAGYDPKEGVFKIKSLRNTLPAATTTVVTSGTVPSDRVVRTGQRMRGLVSRYKVTWYSNSVQDKVLTSVTTKYRTSNGAKRLL